MICMQYQLASQNQLGHEKQNQDLGGHYLWLLNLKDTIK